MIKRFKVRSLLSERHGGEQLEAARVEHGWTIQNVAELLRMPVRYITALEAGDWNNLPGGNYRRYFLRQYAHLLGVPAEPLLSGAADYINSESLKLPHGKKVKLIASMTNPAQRILWGVAILLVIAYLMFGAWQAFSPPKLSLITPSADITTESPTIQITGDTEPGVQVTINNEAAEVGSDGSFLEIVALIPGLNSLTVTAQKPYSHSVSQARQILYIPVASPPSPQSKTLLP